MFFGSFWFNFHKFVGRVPTFKHVQTVHFFLSPLCVGQIRNYSIFPHKKAKETTWSHFPWQKNMFSFISTQKTPRSFQWCQPSFLHVACAHVAGQRQPPYHRLLRLRLEIKLFAAAAKITIPKSRKYDGFVVITL